VAAVISRAAIGKSSIPIAALAALLGSSGAATAQSVEEFYKGKTISAVIGHPPGGGYDVYMRVLARHIGRHIPGNPAVVLRNMPGAGSLIAANHLFNQAARDGTVIGLFASSSLFSVKFGAAQARFEIDRFTWIGNMDQTIGTCTVWHTSGINSLDDLRAKEVPFGASGPSSVNSVHARGLNALLGTQIKVIHGYPGSTNVLLAMERKEVAGGCGFALSSLKATHSSEWQSGQLKVFLQTGLNKSTELPGVPHLFDYAETDDDRKVMDLIYGTHVIGRPISAPPAIPADRVRALRDAFNATMKDKRFLDEAEKQSVPIDPWTGEETQKIIAKFAGYPDTIYARANKLMEK
jgi:tripartite-type tricarboxylate transporter receptor subunit TctC